MTDKDIKGICFYALLPVLAVLWAFYSFFIGMPRLAICDLRDWYREKKAREKAWEALRKKSGDTDPRRRADQDRRA